jgi:solute carrier family 45, member 1/2/4
MCHPQVSVLRIVNINHSTLYIGQVMAYELQYDPTVDEATRIGEMAMMIHSCVAVVSGTILPHLAQRDQRLLAKEGDESSDDAEMVRIRNTVLEWKAEAARAGKPVDLPYMPFLLRNIWTGALLLFSCLMLSTFFVTTVNQAIVVVALVGICWAVACWVPFAMIMEVGVHSHPTYLL